MRSVRIGIVVVMTAIGCGGAQIEGTTDAASTAACVDASAPTVNMPDASVRDATADVVEEPYVDPCLTTALCIATCARATRPFAWAGDNACKEPGGLPRREFAPGQFEHRPSWIECERIPGCYCCPEASP